MSAIVAVVADGDREPGPRAVAGRLLAALGHRGGDGEYLVTFPGAALGGRLFWTTPEAEGEAGPVVDSEGGAALAFEGRLDNRAELVAALEPPQGTGVSDARLALAAFRAWGRRFAERLLGPFAIVVYEPAARRLLAVRDPLGDRTLAYRHTGGELALASEPAALLEHPAASRRLDETSVARFFAVRPPLAGSTYFAELRELPPGHRLAFEGGRLEVERYWPPAELPERGYRSDDEAVEDFRAVLAESVRCRLRGRQAPAVLMSGGLDSTSVAATAARELGEGERLTAISWVFDELARADERRFIAPMIERFGLDARPIRGDGEWPLRDLETWPVEANAPWQGLYCRLQDRAYRAAREAGASALLTGEYGDHLYLDEAYWLRDLLAAGRFREALRELGRELARSPRALLEAGPLRSAALRSLGWRGRPPAPPAWLTPEARRLAALAEAPAPGARERARHYPGVLDPLAAHASSLEVTNAARAGIEVRRPYRDRRLVELALMLPAHLLYRRGWTKWILRRAMKGLLPEPVRLRRHPSTLLPLAVRGLAERELAAVERLLGGPEATWRRYVDSAWLERVFPSRLTAGRDGVENVVAWQCICMELWRRRMSL